MFFFVFGFFVFFFCFFGFLGFFGSGPLLFRPPPTLKLQLILLNFLWDQKKHLQGTGASIFLKSIIFHFFIFVVDKDLSKNSCFTHATKVLSVRFIQVVRRFEGTL